MDLCVVLVNDAGSLLFDFHHRRSCREFLRLTTLKTEPAARQARLQQADHVVWIVIH